MASGMCAGIAVLSKETMILAVPALVVALWQNVHKDTRKYSYVGFLGFGLHFPNLDWGDMISDGVGYMQDGYWWLIYPVGVCIVLTVMSLNFIGDALRDSLDVRLRRR